MKIVQILLILFVAYECYSLKCHDCARVVSDRCEKNINLPKRDCPEPTLDEKERLGFKAVCVKTSRKLLKNNMTFFERQCGMIQPENSTCSFLEGLHEDESTDFVCMECEKDFCNGTQSSDMNIIALIVKILSILSLIKLF